MTEFELDIPSLTEDGLQMDNSFDRVTELTSSSMMNELIMIEMLILLINSFNSIASYQRIRVPIRAVPFNIL